MKLKQTPIASAVALALAGMAFQSQAQTPRPAIQETVTVTGIRASVEKSLETKRNADAMVEVITADDIGKMPDKNVADARAAVVEAGAPTDQLKSSVEQIVKVLEDPALKPDARAKDRRAAIRKEAAGVFDFTESAKRALGRHRQNLSEKDREEFTGLFTDLIARSYIGKIEMYSGERIQFVGDSVDGDQATVRTRLVTKAGMEVPVDYRMHRVSGDRWLAYDVAVEGVSMVSNYRAQFNKIIQISGYKSLVSKLAAKQEEGLEADRELTIRKASQTK